METPYLLFSYDRTHDSLLPSISQTLTEIKALEFPDSYDDTYLFNNILQLLYVLHMQEDNEIVGEVNKVNAEFYHAFESLSIEMMDKLWK
jgi:hypothetical protein